jgi:hypothetical protein
VISILSQMYASYPRRKDWVFSLNFKHAFRIHEGYLTSLLWIVSNPKVDFMIKECENAFIPMECHSTGCLGTPAQNEMSEES